MHCGSGKTNTDALPFPRRYAVLVAPISLPTHQHLPLPHLCLSLQTKMQLTLERSGMRMRQELPQTICLQNLQACHLSPPPPSRPPQTPRFLGPGCQGGLASLKESFLREAGPVGGPVRNGKKRPSSFLTGLQLNPEHTTHHGFFGIRGLL